MDCPNLNSKGEDNRLINWQKWIESRKAFHQRMHEIQHRRPSELALNAAEDYRTIKEVQLLHEYAKIPEIISDRGKPSFWNLPIGSRKFPSLLSVMPKQLDYEVPERTTVGVPTLVQQEKDTVTGEKKYAKWFKNEYLQQRSKQLENEIKRIAPHIPETENLLITGNSCFGKDGQQLIYENLRELEEQIIDDSGSESKSSENKFTADPPLKSLQIEDATFTADGCQEIKKFLVFIDYEIGKHDIVYKSITLKNVGNVALRYHWYRHLPKKVLQDIIPSRLPEFTFIFTKNESIILPNNSTELKISFKTNKPGLYKEIWELRTEPNVFDGQIIKGEFFLVLYACAEIADFAASEAAILNRLEEGMKCTTVEDTILNILQQMQYITAEEEECGHKVTEKDLFEAANAKFGPPGTLPCIFHYNNEIVKKLKNMYDELKTDADPTIWSYKIDDLENLINKCQTTEEQNFYKFSFEELVNQIFKSSMIENEEREKYQNVYDLLCIMVDQMSEKIYALRDKYKIPLIETYPAVTEEILMKQENLDDNCRGNIYFPDITAEAAVQRIKECKTDEFEKPPMEVLKLLPFDDIDQKYKLYHKEKYGIDVDAKETDKKGKKGKDAKKGNADKKGKDAKKGKSDKTGKADKSKKEKVKTTEIKKNFILRKESVIRQKSLTNFLTDEVEILPEYLCVENYEEPSVDSLRMYYYNLYITIHLLLCEAVNEIQGILEYMKSTQRISRDVLRKCMEFGIPTMPDEDEISQLEFKAKLQEIQNHPSTLISDTSFTRSNNTGLLSDISKSYSEYDNEFFEALSSLINVAQEVELVDAQTETDCDELFPPKTRIGHIQTDEDKEEFDLVAQIERELSATSVQHFKKPTADKFTQVERCAECILEGHNFLTED